MKYPDAVDWSFDEISSCDQRRAMRLEHSKSADEMVEETTTALSAAIEVGKVRYGLDSLDDRFEVCRGIIQFQVSPDIFDWFFKARTGYRAQFWMNAEAGLIFNERMIKVFADTLENQLPQVVTARKIKVSAISQCRDEQDDGPCDLRRDFLRQSLHLKLSKVWICERLIQCDGGNPQDTGSIVAAISQPKLRITRWMDAKHPDTDELGEGLRAPFPTNAKAWLDLKGGFVNEGSVSQVKSAKRRATALYERGWT